MGEAADDHGGPYREVLSLVCAELQSDALGLLLPSPNKVHGASRGQEAWVPAPSALAPAQVRCRVRVS